MANEFIKPAGLETEFTPEAVEEFKRCATDPIYFICNHVYVQHPKRGKIRFELYDFQKRLIKSLHEGTSEDWIIALLSRQSGKTQTISMFLLWCAIFNFDQQILIASKNGAHATEIMDRIKYAYEELPFWLKPGVLIYNRQSITFDNKSQIRSESTTEKTGRGLSLSWFYWDECAFVKPNIQEAMWSSLAPTLATGGRAIISSTPNGDADLFANLWNGAELGVNGFKPFFSPYNEHPDRDQTYYDQMERRLGTVKCAQEVGCQFISSEARLFDPLFLQNLTNDIKNSNAAFIRKDVTFYEDVEENRMYVIGVDPATGNGNDYTVIELFSFPEMVQVAEFRSNSLSSHSVYSILKGMIKYIESKDSTCFFSVENNGVGEGILALFEADENPPEMSELVSETGKSRKGFNTSDRKKLNACVILKSLIESGAMTIKSRILLHEFKMFVRKGGSYNAQNGATDDCIAACLIVVRVMQQIAEYDDRSYNVFYGHETLNFEDSSEDMSDDFVPILL